MTWLDYLILLPLVVALVWGMVKGVHRILNGLLNLVKWLLIVMVSIYIVGLLDGQYHFLPAGLTADSPVYSTLLRLSTRCIDYLYSWVLSLFR